MPLRRTIWSSGYSTAMDNWYFRQGTTPGNGMGPSMVIRSRQAPSYGSSNTRTGILGRNSFRKEPLCLSVDLSSYCNTQRLPWFDPAAHLSVNRSAITINDYNQKSPSAGAEGLLY